MWLLILRLLILRLWVVVSLHWIFWIMVNVPLVVAIMSILCMVEFLILIVMDIVHWNDMFSLDRRHLVMTKTTAECSA